MSGVEFDSWRASEVGRTRDRRGAKMARAFCPVCDASIVANRPRVGTEIVCRECGAYLEVVSVDPFEVDLPYDDELEGDYDDDDYYDDIADESDF